MSGALRGDPDGMIRVSPTVATLDARAMFAKLREHLSRPFLVDVTAILDARAELDNLVDQVTDLIMQQDGMVDGESAAYTAETLKDVREELQTAEDRVEEKEDEIKLLEKRIEELEEAASDEPESLQAKHAAALHEIGALRGGAERNKERIAKGEALIRNAESLRTSIDYAFRTQKAAAKKSPAAVKALSQAEVQVSAAIERACKVAP